jgi:outer membrane receptor for ferrienterochelin and colicins
MNLNSKYFLLYFSLFFSFISLAQEKQETVKDSLKVEKLEEVVVTGQINPQSVEKSVFEVKVIGRREIEKRAGVNLADLLNQTLNINIVPNLGNGRSEVSLFGLNGQYFKILIDNVPLINEGGFGNGADLTLINLDDVERIEIVEGAMGVQYGSNAVTGIINIITKKSSRFDTEVSIYVQEETVGSEYGLFDQGRHIQSVSTNHYFNEKFFAKAGFLRNQFTGFFNEQLGENHDQNDDLRGHEWLPKTQINPNLLLRFKNSKEFSIHYRFDYLNEIINRNNRSVNENINPSTDTSNPIALDNNLIANRFTHSINAMGRINDQLTFNVVSSFQQQRNDIETYAYVIRDRDRQNVERQEYLSRTAFFTRATVSNLFKTKRFNLQAGYEMTLEEGYGDGLAILLDPNTERVEGRLNTYDGFLSSEYQFSDRFSIRPGIRTSFTNLFGPQYILSLSTKYSFGKDWEFRTVIGSSNKTPTYDELFTFFVDSNHDVQGNPNLNPERGFSVFTHLKKTFKFKDDLSLKSKLSASYIDLEDKIELIVSNPQPLAFRYTNIDAFKSLGFFLENELKYKRLTGGLGFSVIGVSQVLNAEQDANDNFLFNLSANFNLNYSVPKWNSNFTLYLKHNGRVQQFVQKANDQGEQTFERGETEAFSWLDLNYEKSFLNKKIVATIGARNLLDINTVNTSSFPGGAHSDAPTGLPLAYGRSFFLKLNYNLKY